MLFTFYYCRDFWRPRIHTWDCVFENWIFINKASNYWYYSFFLEICTIFIFQRWKLLSLSFSKICHLYHVFSSFPPQASLSFMLLPLLSKKWLIFAKSYYYRSMCDPMYERPAKWLKYIIFCRKWGSNILGWCKLYESNCDFLVMCKVLFFNH